MYSGHKKTSSTKTIPHGSVPQTFTLTPSPLTQPDQVPPETALFFPSWWPELPVRLILLRACSSLVARKRLISAAPQSCPALFCAQPCWVTTLSSQLLPPDHMASFSIQPEREEHVMQTRCQHKTTTLFLPPTKKHAGVGVEGAGLLM